MTCPAMPPVPDELLSRFRTMRDYDRRMRRYGSDLCATIPAPTDLTSILARLAALEVLTVDQGVLIAKLRSDLTVLTSATTAGTTWIWVNSTPYTVIDHNVGLLLDTSTVAISVYLPLCSSWTGESLYFKDDTGDAATNNVTVIPSGTDTIDDDATMVLDSAYFGVEIKSNGSTGWEIV